LLSLRPAFLLIFSLNAAIGVAMVLFLEPAMSVDSLMLAANRLNDFVVPHWPFGYPLFIRTISVLVAIPSIALGLLPVSALSVMEPHYTAATVRTILLVQHSLMAFACASLACRVTTRWWARVLVSTIVYLNPLNLLFVHALQTEGLLTPLVVLAIRAALDLPESIWTGRRRWSEFLGLSLAIALVRYPAIVIAGLPTVIFGLRALSDLFRTRWPALRRDMRIMAASIIAAGGVVAVAAGLSTAFMLAIHVEPRSAAGRAFMYVLASDLPDALFAEAHPSVSRAEFAAFVDALAERSSDALLTADLRAISASQFTWVPIFNDFAQQEAHRCPNCRSQSVWARADHRLNRVMLHAIRFQDSIGWRIVLARIGQFVLPMVDRGPLVEPPYNSWAGEFDDNPRMSRTEIRASFPVQYADWAQPFAKLVGWSPEWAVPLGLLGLAAILFVRRGPLPVEALALVIMSLGYSIVMSIVTVYILRYGVFVGQLTLLAPIVALAQYRKEEVSLLFEQSNVDIHIGEFAIDASFRKMS
jgi:hypothetical protein